jgi:hypothetical protein
MQAHHDVGLDMLGGCVVCEASIASYNGYPSKSGYWKCADDIGEDGFDSVAAFETWLEEDEDE